MSRRVLLSRIVYLLVLLVGMGTVLYFGSKKCGFHEDELYSYYSSNRSLGLYTPDREWVSSQTLTDEFVVLPGEGFRYGQVRMVQSWDVHPPLYYDLLHTACSLVPGRFTKWTGLLVNLAAYVLCFFLLLLLSRRMGLSRKLTAVFLLLWAINPMTVSAAMFIRMYMWLTAWVLACLYLHLRLLERYSRGRMALVMVVNVLGFLTHYYYLIFLFFTGVAMWILWFFQHSGDLAAADLQARISRMVRYAFFTGVSLAAALLYYPAALSHIFRGYRGKEAVQAFTLLSGWAGRISFFGSLLNGWLFSGALPVILFLYIILVIAGGRRIGRSRPGYVLILVPTIGYFLVVAETALLLGDSSSRYMMPVYPLILWLVVTAGAILLARMLRTWRPDRDERRQRGMRAILQWRGVRAVLMALFVGLFLFIDLSGLFISEHVLFLYPENAARLKIVSANRDIPVIILYNEEKLDNIWRLYDRLAEFPKVYFMDSANPEPVTDPEILKSRTVLVFASDTADNMDRNARLSDLAAANPALTARNVIDREAMWTWMLLGESSGP